MFGKDFQKIWGDSESGSSLFGKSYKPKEPLKYALVHSQYKLSSMISRLDAHISRMQERDRTLFERVIEAQMSKDTARAAMYANEVAEIRKATKQLMITQVALEQVKLRMETISEIGDVFVNLIPVVGVVNQLKTTLKGVMPEISLELSELGDGLQEVVMESGEFMGGSSYTAAESPEARKILEEATAVAEQKMKEQFPDLPSSSLPLTARQKA
ncbi:cell division protein CdvB1/B2 [Sulfuracidifex tepidarius]|uniref:Cell division protein B1 n=1 Tax=Sulfuracidifex tepidarius TaxID=1294262 RepID=A0A510DVS5_9CREN|nr:cell division protein CdvB1/B2 [Sulfuracidifex tepidarius]BBG24333.1 Cell division protein B1 [Sulfuracidifex tepidarius]BBG27090.1 Cell division protein B1 [Sulfuracidifex tepidarius]